MLVSFFKGKEIAVDLPNGSVNIFMSGNLVHGTTQQDELCPSKPKRISLVFYRFVFLFVCSDLHRFVCLYGILWYLRHVLVSRDELARVTDGLPAIWSQEMAGSLGPTGGNSQSYFHEFSLHFL